MFYLGIFIFTFYFKGFSFGIVYTFCDNLYKAQLILSPHWCLYHLSSRTFDVTQDAQERTDEQEDSNFRFSEYRDRKSLVEKDVNRTDRTHPFYAGDNNPNLIVLQDILMTYVMYNFDLGYVQGMSDILAPVLLLLNNEVDSFWCFVGFMDKIVSILTQHIHNHLYINIPTHNTLHPHIHNTLHPHTHPQMSITFTSVLSFGGELRVEGSTSTLNLNCYITIILT